MTECHPRPPTKTWPVTSFFPCSSVRYCKTVKTMFDFMVTLKFFCSLHYGTKTVVIHCWWCLFLKIALNFVFILCRVNCVSNLQNAVHTVFWFFFCVFSLYFKESFTSNLLRLIQKMKPEKPGTVDIKPGTEYEWNSLVPTVRKY